VVQHAEITRRMVLVGMIVVAVIVVLEDVV
jgi:hypothetical protein